MAETVRDYLVDRLRASATETRAKVAIIRSDPMIFPLLFNEMLRSADSVDEAADAIAALNRRATDPAVAELVEALRRSYARLGDAATRINTLPRTTDTLLEVNLRQERSRIESLLAKHAAKP